MKNTIKRLLSVFLVTVMLIGIAPLGGLTGLFIKSSAVYHEVGDIVKFGSYPQSEVKDSSTLSVLRSYEDGLNWVSYRYYTGTDHSSDGNMKPSDYMWYADETIGGQRYRAVKFSQYRPRLTGYTSSASNTYQDENGYYPDNIYWFKYEPLMWRVLDPDEGFIMCESIIDSQAFSNHAFRDDNNVFGKGRGECLNKSNEYASDWKTSSLSSWLNSDFYNTAFTSSQQNKIKLTELENKSAYKSQYDGKISYNRVFLLSYWDAINPDYGFNSGDGSDDTARRAQGTDYPKCQGLCVIRDSGSVYNGDSYWRLRSPCDSYDTGDVYYSGFISDDYSVGSTYIGIRPALKITNLSSLISQSNFNFTQTHTVDNYQAANAGYKGQYFSGAGVPLDGSNGNPDFCIPGLSSADNFVPQGCGYDPDTGTVLTTSYKYNNDGNSMLFALDGETGDMIGEYFLNDQYGDVVKSHVGGVAVYNNTIYIANDTGILTYDTARLADSGEMRATGFYNISDKLNGAKCSYVTVSDGILWTGNFYDADDSRYNHKADTSQTSIITKTENSVILGFDLNKSKSLSSPDYKFNIDNAIENIQSAYYTGRTLYLVTSFGRTNDSVLYFADTEKSSSVILTENKFNNVRCLPMMENGFIKDGYLYSMFESAAWKYHGAEDTVSRDPTDVIWKIDLNQMKKNACLLGRDTPSLSQSVGFSGSTNYIINENLYQNLAKNARFYETSNLRKCEEDAWNGSCYGIATTIALSKNNLLRVQNMTSMQNVAYYSDLPKPCDDKKLKDIINYYYLMQFISKGGKDAIISKNYGYGSNDILLKTVVNAVYNRLTLIDIVNYAASDGLYVLSFINKSSGHTYAMVDCCKVDGKFKVKLFDVNSVRKFVYMYIEPDFSSFRLDGNEFGNGDYIEIADVGRMLDLNGNRYNANSKAPAGTRAAEDSHTKFYIVPDHAFTLSNAAGQTLRFDGENFSGDMTVYDLDVVVKDVDSEYVFEIDNSDIFTLDCSGKIDCSLGNDDTYFSVDGENISGVTFSADTMKLDGKNITFKAFVSTDEEVAENELGLVSISASSAAGVTLYKNNDCVEVTSDGDMSSIEAASYVGTEKETQTYDGKTDKITLTADDVIVAEKKVRSVSVDDVTLNYKKSAKLKPAITADEGVKYTVSYKSSNPKAASVDKDGNVKALKRGNATITVTVTDQYGNEVKDTCNVTVKYSILQWIIVIVLFGWLWY